MKLVDVPTVEEVEVIVQGMIVLEIVSGAEFEPKELLGVEG